MLFKNMAARRWIVLCGIAVAVTVLRVLLQPLIPDAENPLLTVHSAIYDAGLLVPAFTIYMFVIAFLLGMVFVLIEEHLPGTRLTKGLSFGLAFGLMWSIYLIEPVIPVQDWTFMQAYAYPIVDGITLIVLGLLLGLFAGTARPAPEKPRASPGALGLLAFPLAFLAVRYVIYPASLIVSAWDIRPFDTMVWVTAAGMGLGVMYFLLRPGITAKQPISKALFYGVVVLGINLLLFNLFAGIVYEINVADMLLRTLIDITAVIIGVYACEKICVIFGGGQKADDNTVAANQ